MSRSLSSTLRAAVLGAVLAGVLATPCPALADGPGYGGNADSLVCHWRLKIGGRGPGLLVFAVGFRAGSQAHLRVGAGADRLVVVDGSGALRILVVLDTSSRAVPSSTRPSSTRPSPGQPSPAASSHAPSSPRATSRATPAPTVSSHGAPSRRIVSQAFMIGPAARTPASPTAGATTSPTGSAAAQPTDLTTLMVPGDSVSRLSPGTSVLVVGETPAGGLRTLVGSVPPPVGDSGIPGILPGTGAAASLGAVLFWFRRRRATPVGGAHRHRPAARHRA